MSRHIPNDLRTEHIFAIDFGIGILSFSVSSCMHDIYYFLGVAVRMVYTLLPIVGVLDLPEIAYYIIMNVWETYNVVA